MPEGTARELPEGPAAWRAALAIAGKDLRLEWRSRAVTVATVFFSAIVLVLLAFAVGANDAVLAEVGPGVLWVALAFAGVISSAQGYAAEHEDGAFEQLLLYPVPRASIYLGKLLANWLYTAALGLLLLPTTALLYGLSVPVRGWPVLIATVALGTLGFALISTFYAALTSSLRARESLLPVLMFPVVVPILLAAVRATDATVRLDDLAAARDWLQLLTGFDLVYAVTCTAIFAYLTDE